MYFKSGIVAQSWIYRTDNYIFVYSHMTIIKHQDILWSEMALFSYLYLITFQSISLKKLCRLSWIVDTYVQKRMDKWWGGWEFCSQLVFCPSKITISLQIIVVRITICDLGFGFRKQKIVMTSEENLEHLEDSWGHSNLSSSNSKMKGAL